MKCFKYNIVKNDRKILKNYINAENKADAIAKLEKEHVGCEIRLTEVFPNTWM
jgi:type II secretory pathway component PulF